MISTIDSIGHTTETLLLSVIIHLLLFHKLRNLNDLAKCCAAAAAVLLTRLESTLIPLTKNEGRDFFMGGHSTVLPYSKQENLE